MEYKCLVRDPNLNNICVLDDDFDNDDMSNDDERKERITYEYSTLKPFLDKYGLTVEYLDENDEKIDFSEQLAKFEGGWTEIGALPTPEDVADCLPYWEEHYPWMRLDYFEGFPYPLCWQYSRPTMKEIIEEKGENFRK